MSLRRHSNEEPWWLRGNFYSLYIDKFARDLNGLIDRLDYFTYLGIDCLHLLPHYPSPRCDDGYDVTDHTGVHPDLGSVEDLVQLCQSAHERGIRVMVDLILNHVSDQHPWFIEARANKKNSKRDYFLWSDNGSEFAGAPNVLSDFKAANWLWNEDTKDYYYATFKPCQPDLNWSNDAVLVEMLSVVDTLVAQGVDGFRLDAIMNLVERENTTSVGLPETHERIRQVRAHLDKHHPQVILLGEVVGTTDYARGYFGESNECHLSYNFELMAEMLYVLRMGGRHDRLKAVLEASRALPEGASWMAFLRNHDSITLSTLDPDRAAALLAVLDPQHEYGFNRNQETAQRLFAVCAGDETLVKEAFSMLYAVPSATVLYYGDEIGMDNALPPPGETDRRRAVRAPFEWEKVEAQKQDPQSLLSHVRRCITKRKGL